MKLPVEVHPVADIFPMMEREAFEALKADIAEHGQREPVTFWRDQLLDGRNRYLACLELNLEPLEQMLDDDHPDPVGFAMSLNLHRRHLTTSQRAMVAAKLANLQHGSNRFEAKVERKNFPSTTLEQAAEMLKVSDKTVKHAKSVAEHGAKPLVEAVERGEVPVSLAAKLVAAEPDKKEQAKLAKQGKEAIHVYLTPPDELPKKQTPCRDEQAVAAFRRAENRLNVLKHILQELDDHERAVVADCFSEWLGQEE
jgi:ParB-like chromosome segregation protein Spo0J